MEMEDIDTPVDEALLNGEPVVDQKDTPAPQNDPDPDEATAKTEEDKATTDKAEAEEPKATDQQIPRARFNEVNAKLHEERDARAAAEAELAALKAAPAPDIAELRKEQMAALMAGEEEKALELSAKIDAEIERRAEEKAFARAEAAALQRDSNKEYHAAYAQAVKDYPVLDKNTGNPEAIAETAEYRDFLVSKGVGAAEALTRAAQRIAASYTEQAAASADPANVVQIDPRKAAAIARNAGDAKKQPAAPVAGMGNRAVPSTPVPEKQEDWEKLPEAERAKHLA